MGTNYQKATSPFIPMYPNGQPQGNFFVNGLSAPVYLSKQPVSRDTSHLWTGYLKIMVPGTYYFSIHADSSLSLSIGNNKFEMVRNASSSGPANNSVELSQGYYRCRIEHEHHAVLGSGQQFYIALKSTEGYADPAPYLMENPELSEEDENRIIKLVNLYEEVEDESSSSSSVGEGPSFEFDPKSSSSSAKPSGPEQEESFPSSSLMSGSGMPPSSSCTPSGSHSGSSAVPSSSSSSVSTSSSSSSHTSSEALPQPLPSSSSSS